MFSKVELFLNCLNRFNVKDANGDALRHVEEAYLSLPIFKEDPKDPPVVDGLKTWAVNIVAMYHIYEMIKPQQKKLNLASKEWEQMATKVSDLSGRVNTLEARLTGLMGNFQDATEEKNAAIARLQDLTASCNIASKLAGALNVSSTNQIAAAKMRYEEEEESLLGDALVASALVTYAGWMDEASRDAFMQDHVLADLRAQKIRVSPVMPNSALQTLTTPATVALWKAKGLVDSRYYVESATMALNCASWPLLVDPQGLALAWLTGHVEECSPPVAVGGSKVTQGIATPTRKRPMSGNKTPELALVSNSSLDLVSVLRTGLSVGRSVAINGPLTTLRREILMVLLRSFFMHKRVVVVQLDGEMVEVHPDFRLFLLTGQGRMGFEPQFANMCTVINFMCSVAGLHDIILDHVIRSEMPEMLDRAAVLLDRRRSLFQEREHLEDSMLLTLGETDGIVLSDAVVSRLVDDLGLMDRVAGKLKAADHDLKAFDASRAAYRSLVETAETIYQATEVMEQMHPAYVFSTAAFLDAVTRGLVQASEELEPFEWSSIFKGKWTTSNEVFSDEEDEELSGEDDVISTGALVEEHSEEAPQAERKATVQDESVSKEERYERMHQGMPAHQAKAQDASDDAHKASRPPSGKSGPIDEGSRPASQGSGRGSQGSRGSKGSGEGQETGTVEIPDADRRFRVLQAHIWEEVLRECCAGMQSQDQLVFAVYSAISVSLFRMHGIEYSRVHEVLEVFLTFSNIAQKGYLPSSGGFQSSELKPPWLGDGPYAAVAQLSQLKRRSPLHDLLHSLDEFKAMVESPEPELPQSWAERLSDIEKWVAMQSLRPDMTVSTAISFVKRVLGCAGALEQHLVNLPGLLSSMSCNRPILLLFASSVLVTDMVVVIEASVGHSVPLVTLGVDSHEQHCIDMISKAYNEGSPVIVEGAHHSKLWVQNVLDPLMSKMAQDDSLANSNFRLILLAPTFASQAALVPFPHGLRHGVQQPAQGLTADILGQCSKIMFEHPRNPRADFMYNLRALTYFEDVELDHVASSLDAITVAQNGSGKTDYQARSTMLRPLLFSLSIMHAAMRSCLISGAVKENERLEHGVSDLTSALATALCIWGADNYQDTSSFSNPMLLPWSSFRTIISRMSLGALVTDPWEERLFHLQLNRALPWSPSADEEEFGTSMRVLGTSHVERRVDFRGISALAAGDVSFPDIEQRVVDMWQHEGVMTRELTGLAHTAIEQSDAHHLQRCLGDLRFVRRKREINRQDKAKMTLDEINERLPKTLDVPPPLESGGEQSPFYQVYVREMASMNVLLTTMSHSLLQLELALEGQTRVGMDLELLIDAFCHDVVPAQWLKVSHPSGRTLGGWFNDMVQRCDLLHDWCASRVLPPVVWLSGLCHPEAFIAAVIMHHSLVNRWPLAETVSLACLSRSFQHACVPCVRCCVELECPAAL